MKLPAPTKKQPKPTIHNLRDVRIARGENQSTFWNRYGVTQSCGSRYETERDIPVPTGALALLHLTGVIDEAVLAKAIKAAV